MTNRRLRTALAGLFAPVLLLSLFACSSKSDALVVYNAQHESLTSEWVKAFTEQTGIKVELRNGSDFDLGNQLVAEGDASKADVFLTENSPAISMVAQKDLLAPVGQEAVANVPETYRPAGGNWVGIAARSTVFIYNKDKVREDELPRHVDDLANERWRGKWGAAPAGADFQAIVSASLELEGQDATRKWLEGLQKPGGGFNTFKGNIPILAAVNRGELDGGLEYHYYFYGDQAGTKENSQKVGMHFFRDGQTGSFLSLSGGGVLKNAPHADKAQQFLAFVTSQRGQEILRDASFEYPVGSRVGANAALPPLDSLKAPHVDPSTLNGPPVQELLTSIGLT